MMSKETNDRLKRDTQYVTLRQKTEEKVREMGERSKGTGIRITYIVYYESLNRELKTKPINECRCDERLQTRVEESTRLVCPQLVVELEHLKIETRLIDEMFASEMGEYVFLM